MWRKDELDRINSTTTGPERKAALCMLLEQEATLIASIGRHKVVADVKNQDKQVKQFVHIHLLLCSRAICLFAASITMHVAAVATCIFF